MHTERPTQHEVVTGGTPTLEPTSRARTEGTLWAERLFAQAAPASDDVTRFAVGLAQELAQ